MKFALKLLKGLFDRFYCNLSVLFDHNIMSAEHRNIRVVYNMLTMHVTELYIVFIKWDRPTLTS